MGKKILSPKSDIIFKLLFGVELSIEILTDFLKAVLNIPTDDYDEVTIVDPHLHRQREGDKLGILDVKVKTKSKKIIDIEIQVKPRPHFKNRVVYCLSKMITEQIGSGEDYSKIQRAISIIITDFTLIPENGKYHNRHTFRNEDGLQLTNIMEINTLELSKIPPAEDGTPLWQWMKFLNAESKEEFDMIAEKNPVIKKAVVRLEQLSQDERTRMLYESQQLREWDVALEKKGAILNIAKRMLDDGESVEKIMRYFNLTLEDIEEMRNADY